MQSRHPVRHQRRRFLIATLAAGVPLTCGTFAAAAAAADAPDAPAGPDPDEERWRTLASHYFGDRPISDGAGLLEIDAPQRAHDAAIVPITVRAIDPGRAVHRLHLIVDRNPLPLAGTVAFAPAGRDWQSLETRIRINEYTRVRAVGELADGSLVQVSRFVKAAGGCSAPAMADMAAALANAGRMKVLLGRPDGTLPGSPVSEAVIRIRHPNHSGMQFDQISRHYIPAFFVDTIDARVDDEPLFSVKTNFSMSENPVVHLRYRPRGGSEGRTLSVSATDSRGNGYRHDSDS